MRWRSYHCHNMSDMVIYNILFFFINLEQNQFNILRNAHCVSLRQNCKLNIDRVVNIYTLHCQQCVGTCRVTDS